MKSKTKTLFLSLFAFASLALAACGNNGGSSSTPSGSSSQDSSESSSSSEGSEDSSTDDSSSEDEQTVDVFVKVNELETKLTYDSIYEQYSVSDVELLATDVLSVYTKDAAGSPVSLADKIVFADTDSEALFKEDKTGVKANGTYSFTIVYDETNDKYSLTVTKAFEATYNARLTSGTIANKVFIHAWNLSGGVATVEGAVTEGNKVAFTIKTPGLTNFLVCELKPDLTVFDWDNVLRQSTELAFATEVIDFEWAPVADDPYQLWGSTNPGAASPVWTRLGKFTETAGVYTAEVYLDAGTEFVFHLEQFTTEDAGWRNFADLVGTGVSGNFAAKGGTGTDSNNIIVSTAGDYTFTVTTEHKVQVVQSKNYMAEQGAEN